MKKNIKLLTLLTALSATLLNAQNNDITFYLQNDSQHDSMNISQKQGSQFNTLRSLPHGQSQAVTVDENDVRHLFIAYEDQQGKDQNIPLIESLWRSRIINPQHLNDPQYIDILNKALKGKTFSIKTPKGILTLTDKTNQK